jgi:hypothetical protein
MKTELAKKLLKNIIENIVEVEDSAEEIFAKLHFLAEYKYDRYEMFAPGRHFLEYFYRWIKQFEPQDRKVALDLVLSNLIFISRREFEMLSKVLYFETVRKIQFDLAAEISDIPRHKVSQIARSEELKDIMRCSLFIGMSDGARIDYFRRQHKDIGNEQVLASYHVDKHKCDDMIEKLEKECGQGKRFRLVFLIDDFCASGSTLIRTKDKVNISGTLSQLETKSFPQVKTIKNKPILVEPTLLDTLLSNDSKIFLCPMLSTKRAIDHIAALTPKLKSQLNKIEIKPTAILDDKYVIDPEEDTNITKLCKKYYQERMGDEHTGRVTFGYKDCGLTIVLHHNTPNNSLYLFWNRRAMDSTEELPQFMPLFKRIERHRSLVQ